MSCPSFAPDHSRLSFAFTLVELLIVVAIIAILAAILFPVFARARENARRSSCQSNERQIDLGLLQYTQDYDETLPPWLHREEGTPIYVSYLLAPYLKSNQVWKCPSTSRKEEEFAGDPSDPYTSYGMNTYSLGSIGICRPLAAFAKPSETLIFCESAYPADGVGGTGVFPGFVSVPTARHLETLNVAFLDGHIKAMRLEVVTRTASTEDGTPLGGDDQYVIWNVY